MRKQKFCLSIDHDFKNNHIYEQEKVLELRDSINKIYLEMKDDLKLQYEEFMGLYNIKYG